MWKDREEEVDLKKRRIDCDEAGYEYAQYKHVCRTCRFVLGLDVIMYNLYVFTKKYIRVFKSGLNPPYIIKKFKKCP
jgi:hypothetical protein